MQTFENQNTVQMVALVAFFHIFIFIFTICIFGSYGFLSAVLRRPVQ